MRALAEDVSSTLRSEWWERLFQLSEDAQVICNNRGEIWEANRFGQRLFGLQVRSREAKRMVFENFTHATSQKLKALFSKTEAHQESLTSVSLMDQGRLTLMADLVATPLTEQFWLLTIKDASRRWRMESHVQRLATAIDATSDVFFLTDAEFKLTFVNAAFHSVTGHTIEEALGRPADFLRARHELPKILQYTDAVRQGMDWCGELENVRADGTVYPVEATISPIHDRKGGLIGYVSFERDTSTKKRLQNELLLERNYARSINNSLEAAIYTIDREFRLTHFNEGWKKFPRVHGCLTMEKAPMKGELLLTLVKEEARREEIAARFKQVLETGAASEFCSASPDGSHWQIKVSPWTHENEISGLIYVVQDQTKFHQVQAQLFQAQKMETLGALAAGVAHDFNNLLQVIRGNTTLLIADQYEDAPVTKRLEQISEAAGRASEITEQLLSFSRVSDEKVTIIDFNHLIADATQLAQRSLNGNVQLSLRPGSRPMKVKMDATRAHQLLLNLCVNAQDAMPGGGSLIVSNTEVELEPFKAAGGGQVAGGRFVRCTVADSGMGIPPEVLPRIFDPFFTTKEVGKGTGLGLSIAQSAVLSAGGKIEVETEAGKGTAFHIYLPLVEEEITLEVRPATKIRLHGTGRVLVVEDLDLVRDFTETFLKNAGLEVLVARDATDALEVLEAENGRVDLLLTDFNMPGMNGVDLLEEVRPRWPGIKLVLASGYLQDAQRDRITNEFKARILKKPYNPRDATSMILDLLAPLP
jgi:two-component system cell cycle sensor histidine kinase/response regulator CckA